MVMGEEEREDSSSPNYTQQQRNDNRWAAYNNFAENKLFSFGKSPKSKQDNDDDELIFEPEDEQIHASTSTDFAHPTQTLPMRITSINKKDLGFAFTVGGLLLPYFVGAYSALKVSQKEDNEEGRVLHQFDA